MSNHWTIEALKALEKLRAGDPCYATLLAIISFCQQYGGVKLIEIGTDEKELKKLRGQCSEAVTLILSECLEGTPRDEPVLEGILAEIQNPFEIQTPRV